MLLEVPWEIFLIKCCLVNCTLEACNFVSKVFLYRGRFIRNVWRARSNHQRCSMKKGVWKIFANSSENTCARASFFNKVVNKETLTQVFSCEFCEIFKNTSFTEHLWVTASILTILTWKKNLFIKKVKANTTEQQNW